MNDKYCTVCGRKMNVWFKIIKPTSYLSFSGELKEAEKYKVYACPKKIIMDNFLAFHDYHKHLILPSGSESRCIGNCTLEE